MSSCTLLIEPFYGGSHQQLMDGLYYYLQSECLSAVLITLPAKKWQWRARTSALYFSQKIPKDVSFQSVFASSVLNLAELLALRPDLRATRKIVYFHENQFVYPVRKSSFRDFQYGYNQILTALVADVVLFNSKFNLNSFLDNLDKHFHIQPDHRPKHLKDELLSKCVVFYFPINFPLSDKTSNLDKEYTILHIVWPHRWEHDKDPETFFNVLFQLQSLSLPFRISVLGESFKTIPPVFTEAKERLRDKIEVWGRTESKDEYYNILKQSHIVVSTARHEFFGVAMLEAVYCGCLPLAPNTLVYPEIYPSFCLYNTPRQLFKKLKEFCLKPYLAAEYRKSVNIDFNQFSSIILWPKLKDILKAV